MNHRPLSFSLDDDDQQQQPANWQEQLQDFDWYSNLKALQLELESPHNFRWELTLQVTVVWPAMRKWALQTLQACLTGRTRLTKAQQKEFLRLFQKCPPEKLTRVTFMEPLSIVENMETVSDARLYNNNNDDDNSETPKENPDDNQEDVVSNFGSHSQIWSIEPGNVDPLLLLNSNPDDTLSLGHPGEPAFEDWEPPELKALDWHANMDTLAMELQQPYNQEWDRKETIHIKDPAVRQWVGHTLLECLNWSHRLTHTQRTEFLRLLENMPKNSLRRLALEDAVSIEQDLEKLHLEDTVLSSTAGKQQADIGAGGQESDDSSDGSSVYL